jgi:enoyl-CoA hydratase/carnithine racemase
MVYTDLSDGVARVFLNRPEKANALNSPLLDELRRALEGLGGDEKLRVVVLGGAGRNFSGGADVDELGLLEKSNAGEFVEKIHRVCRAIRELPVPVVARLQGTVIGGALEIAAACDLRVALEDARFSMPEVRLGIPSVVEAALLPRLMGAGRAAWLVLTGEAIDAAKACEWGLVEEVTADLDAAVDARVASLVAGDRAALAEQKKLVQLWQEAPLGESVRASIDAFARAFEGGNTISSRLKRKTH